jgi:hypothetical protein
MIVQEVQGLANMDNHLDAFFLAEMSDIECSINMFKFKTICKRLGVPVADEKTEGPVTSMNYFGLTINNESMCVKIPKETIKELFKKINEVEFSQKGNFETIGIIMW